MRVVKSPVNVTFVGLQVYLQNMLLGNAEHKDLFTSMDQVTHLSGLDERWYSGWVWMRDGIVVGSV